MDNSSAGRPIAGDTRGIVNPTDMMRYVDFNRYEPGGILDGLIDWFWSVRWDLPTGETFVQQVLNHPAGHISIGTLDDRGIPLEPQGRVYGVMTQTSERRLTLCGWTVAAKTTVGGLGVFLNRPARGTADMQFSLNELFPEINVSELVRDIANDDHANDNTRADFLRSALDTIVQTRDKTLIKEARFVSSVAAHAETDRSVCRIEHLASSAGVSVRTLQRLFDTHVGVTPSFVIRRWRIIDAVESARVATEANDSWPGWATLADRLGYADQAHLTRDFQRYLGTTPSAYLAMNQPTRATTTPQSS